MEARPERRGVGQSPARVSRILVLDDDSYLAFLLAQEFGDDAVQVVDEYAEVDDILALRPDLVIAKDRDKRLPDIWARSDRPRIIAISDGRLDGRSREALAASADGILLRPFTPGELKRTVRVALGLRLLRDPDGPAIVRALKHAVAPMRIVAIAYATLYELVGPVFTNIEIFAVVLAFAYVALRAMYRDEGPRLVVADLVMAGALLALTNGLVGGFTVFAAIALFEAGLVLRRRTALVVVVGMLAAGAIGPLRLVASGGGTASTSELALWVVVFPLSALVASLVSDVWHRDGEESGRLLAEANRVLSNLYEIARVLPGGFEARTVATAVLAEVKESLDTPAALFLLEEAGLLSVVGSYGSSTTPGRVLARRHVQALLGHGPRVLCGDDVDDEVDALLSGHDRWAAAPVRHGGIPIGVILVAATMSSGRDVDLDRLGHIATEAGIAVANARLFGRIRELSIDEERSRLATELHDGIAQVLAHVRLELDLLTLDGDLPDSARQETERLVRVIDRGLTDVRSTINGLRSSVAADGLAASLRQYVRDLERLGGPQVLCSATTDIRLDPETESELFRIAQEAVSNALRHAGARTIRVSLDKRAKSVCLTIEDDGLGIGPSNGDSTSGGLGLITMRERADRIGADLTIELGDDGGTRVVVRLPLARDGRPATATKYGRVPASSPAWKVAP